MFVKWFIFRYISIIIIIQRIVYLYNIFLVSSSSIIFINSTYLKSQPITEISSKYQHSSHYVKIILENSSNIIEFIFFFFSIFTLHVISSTRDTQHSLDREASLKHISTDNIDWISLWIGHNRGICFPTHPRISRTRSADGQ